MYILHTSDFHFSKEAENENKKLEQLVEYFKKMSIKIDYVINTGDFIDSREIMDFCANTIIDKYKHVFGSYKYEHETFIDEIKKHTDLIDEYNSLLLNQSKERFSSAAKYFEKFLNSLGINDRKKIVICCGNHDKTRLVFIDNNSECINHNYTESQHDSECFSAFEEFCKQLNLNYGYDSHFYEMSNDNLNFLILNTNWEIPENKSQERQCVKCSDIKQLLKKVKPGFRTIAIAHKPLDNLCEDFKYSYSRDDQSLQDKIEKMLTAYFCGDKHTVKKDTHNDVINFMCGAPLKKNEITYNLIRCDSSNSQFECNTLKYKDGRWRLSAIDSTIEEVYKISSSYISESTNYILNNSSIKLDTFNNAINVFAEFEKERIDTTSTLFKTCCKYKKLGKVNTSLSNKNIFEAVYGMTIESSSQNPINLRGKHGSGKSAFLGIFYLFLMNKYCNGEMFYIPAYFNIGNIRISKDDDPESIILTEFNKFKNNIIKKSEKCSMPCLLLIDGFDEQNCLSDEESIESKISNCINESLNGKVIYSFSKCNFPNLPKSTEYNKESDILYFNPVDVISLGLEEDKFKLFVHSYLKLIDVDIEKYEKEICQNIKEFRKINIDVRFLHTFFERKTITQNNFKTGWNLLYEDYFKKLEKNSINKLKNYQNNANQINHIAYLLAYSGYNYWSIKKEYEFISYTDFCTIKEDKELRNYLLACHYIDELTLFANNPNKRVSQDSILMDFIPREIAILIRLKFTDRNSLKTICNKLKSKANDNTASMLVYLAGHFRMNVPDKKKIITDIQNARKKLRAKQNNDLSSFFKHSLFRTISLANIVCVENLPDRTQIYNLIQNLINNSEERIFNRVYQLLYYGDIDCYDGINCFVDNSINDDIRKGFDFYSCYHVLLSKLEYAVYNEKKHYYFMELDLFTICDLIYSRLNNSKCFDNNGSECDTFFYYSDYNNEKCNLAIDVLKKTSNIISEYLSDEKYNNGLKQTDPIYVYFEIMKKTFNTCISHLMKKTPAALKDMKNELYFAYKLEEISKIQRFPRIGWDINKKGEFDEEERQKYTSKSFPNTIKETILEHVYESLCIALLYLPEKLNIEDTKINIETSSYSKDNVLKYILIHELGKYVTKDYTPDTKEKNTLYSNEKMGVLSNILLASIENQLDLTEYYNMVLSWFDESSSDINCIIAKDITTIQMAYKFAKLKKTESISFEQDREIDFKNSIINCKTNTCQQIYKKLVNDNPFFYS